MLTLEQIEHAHRKVVSGADFPAYIRDLIDLGVARYETYVSDGHARYHTADGVSLISPVKYPELTIAATATEAEFRADLLAHQQGKTDYAAFCADCAKSGIEKWEVHLEHLTCTYFDLSGNQVLEEQIPA